MIPPPVTVGEALADALAAAYDAPSANYTADEQRELGRAHGLAFRAAELAYDLGQRHAREAQIRRQRGGLLLALDTRD